jgi:hypothetical protein
MKEAEQVQVGEPGADKIALNRDARRKSAVKMPINSLEDAVGKFFVSKIFLEQLKAGLHRSEVEKLVDEFFLENLPTDVFRRRRSQLFRNNPVRKEDRESVLKAKATDWQKIYGPISANPSKKKEDYEKSSSSDSKSQSKSSSQNFPESPVEEASERIETSKGRMKPRIKSNNPKQ